MKKVFVLLFAVVALSFASNAQNALGVRFGAGTGTNAELSYQMGLGSNRLELDLGWNGAKSDNSFHLAGIYQWNFNIAGDFNWFIGPGAVLGYCPNHGINLALAGQIGIEFAPSQIPFNFTLDARPSYSFLRPEGCGHNSAFGWGACLGIRYRF